VDRDNPDLSILRQCRLLGLPRSSFYYRPKGESPLNLELMRLLDEQYTQTPFYGSPKMTEWLRDQGFGVNRKRVGRLMAKMGLAAIYQGPGTSQPHPAHKIYPYLLRGVAIERVDQVWSADITYIRLRAGFLYLVAVMDWFSRYVLSWRLSNTLDSSFCVEALEAALQDRQPEIFNTDQGTQFTSEDFTGILKGRQIAISMDGRGRCMDNIFVERLWRTVKYEEVYLRDYQTPGEAYLGLKKYFDFYNRERYHQALNYRTPYEAYYFKSKSSVEFLKKDKLNQNTTLNFKNTVQQIGAS
jgi:putative transposase